MFILVENLRYVYRAGTPMEAAALDGVNMEIEEGSLVGLIGPTASGKSTLVQHLNGLLTPTSGRVVVDGVEVGRKRGGLLELRKRVGLVFQYPEHQLFEETVFDDVAFGPRNLGLEEDEVRKRVLEALGNVGLHHEKLLKRSPFELSGGQMRRVAIAGVLAVKPKVLVLDEPTAGLDPAGQKEILGRIQEFHRDLGMTIILVSHNMEDVARVVQKLFVMHQGKVVLSGSPREVFRHEPTLREMGLDVPQVTRLMLRLKEKGYDVRTDIYTIEEAKREILAKVWRGTVNA